MDSKPRRKHHLHRRRSVGKDTASTQTPSQPEPDERVHRLRENFETDVAPDLIEAERAPIDQKRDEPVCSLPPEESSAA